MQSYFETSHAKGEQDAAGSHVKQKVSQAVLHRAATIKSAESVYEYLVHDTAAHIADLAVKGSTVAIAAVDDPMYDFFLLKVTSEGVEELDSNYTDD